MVGENAENLHKATPKRGKTFVTASLTKPFNNGGSKDTGCVSQRNGQATKGAGRMPWHQRPKKDAVSCEKLRGVASTHRSADVRMEQSG